MKYFRPDLYLQSQPSNDDATIESAMVAWDRAETDYETELRRDWQRLPRAVQWYLDNVRLHDGVLLVDGAPDEDTYRLVVRSDVPSGQYVEFKYFLTDSLEIVDAGFPDDLKSDVPHWLYDEFAADPQPATPSRFTHSILLSDGRELRVRFSDVEVRQFAPLLTAVATST